MQPVSRSRLAKGVKDGIPVSLKIPRTLDTSWRMACLCPTFDKVMTDSRLFGSIISPMPYFKIASRLFFNPTFMMTMSSTYSRWSSSKMQPPFSDDRYVANVLPRPQSPRYEDEQNAGHDADGL